MDLWNKTYTCQNYVVLYTNKIRQRFKRNCAFTSIHFVEWCLDLFFHLTAIFLWLFWGQVWEVTLTGADGLLWLKWVGSSLFICLPVSSNALLWSFAPQFMSFLYISFCFDGCSCTLTSPQTSCLPLSASETNKKALHYRTFAMHLNRKPPTNGTDHCA